MTKCSVVKASLFENGIFDIELMQNRNFILDITITIRRVLLTLNTSLCMDVLSFLQESYSLKSHYPFGQKV